MKRSIIIKPQDNVAVAILPLSAGDVEQGITLLDSIPAGHKFALSHIVAGDIVMKYGAPIGHATCAIPAGSHVHTHNIATNLSGQLGYTYQPQQIVLPHGDPVEIMAYSRASGEVGIRNELLVLPLVGCVAPVGQAIVRAFRAKHPTLCGIDDVVCYDHPYGCSQTGDDHLRTKWLLGQIATHPNYGGVLVLSLGCENNQIGPFMEGIADADKARIRTLVAQDVSDEIDAGVCLLEELYQVARFDKRIPQPISALRVGLKCGGSDGLSGITANPLVGRFCDYLVSVGGTTILTEVPEMFGAEQLLMHRAESQAVFHDIVHLVNDFKQFYLDHGQSIDQNPSPGNKAGGITTLEDKSLGCTQKAGSAVVRGVLMDRECDCKQGLNLQSGPGNDMVAVTNLGCAHCHLVLFTTGRGTPFGGFVPTLKLATNTALSRHKEGWIDFNAGVMVDTDEDALLALIELVRRTADGEYTKAERNGYKQIALFKTGVTL